MSSEEKYKADANGMCFVDGLGWVVQTRRAIDYVTGLVKASMEARNSLECDSGLVKLVDLLQHRLDACRADRALTVEKVRGIVELLRILPVNRKAMGISDLDIANKLAEAIGDRHA